MNDVALNHQVVVNELGREGGVGPDAAHPGRGQKNIIRSFPAKEAGHRALVPQVQLPVLRLSRLVNPAFLRRRRMAPPTRPRCPATKILASGSISFKVCCQVYTVQDSRFIQEAVSNGIFNFEL